MIETREQRAAERFPRQRVPARDVFLPVALLSLLMFSVGCEVEDYFFVSHLGGDIREDSLDAVITGGGAAANGGGTVIVITGGSNDDGSVTSSSEGSAGLVAGAASGPSAAPSGTSTNAVAQLGVPAP